MTQDIACVWRAADASAVAALGVGAGAGAGVSSHGDVEVVVVAPDTTTHHGRGRGSRDASPVSSDVVLPVAGHVPRPSLLHPFASLGGPSPGHSAVSVSSGRPPLPPIPLPEPEVLLSCADRSAADDPQPTPLCSVVCYVTGVEGVHSDAGAAVLPRIPSSVERGRQRDALWLRAVKGAGGVLAVHVIGTASTRCVWFGAHRP